VKDDGLVSTKPVKMDAVCTGHPSTQ
jgi:hypothetical protein